MLASALATRIRWTAAFDEVPGSALGGPFGYVLAAMTALATPATGHTVRLARIAAAGLVGVHEAGSADGLRVLSVIADPAVVPADVHAAAVEVAGPTADATAVSLFDLPLGPGHAWDLTETVESSRPGAPARRESGSAVLPAWSATSSHDLTAEPGVLATTTALDALVRADLRPVVVEAAQTAVASYGAEGFEAAAVTAMAVRASAVLAPMVEVRHRSVRVRFDRPYAVLAVTRGEDATAAWDGVPVLGAWVAEPRG